jgi:hypothetical protein
MAKAKGGLFSLKAQGRIGDAVAFRGSHGQTVLQKISPSGKPASAAQAAARAGYAYNCQVWQSLPPAMRALWADERPQVSTNKGFSNFMSAVSGWVKWYNPAWLGRVKVTMAAPALAGFPVLTTQNQLTAAFFAGVLASGADIVVTAEDGITKLPRELVSINKAGSTIELYHASPAGAMVYYVYYFNAAGAEVNDTAVWDAGFIMVQHMNDGENTSHIHDSTANTNHGTKKGAAEPAEATGAFTGDKAQLFDGSDDDVDIVNSTSLRITGNFSATVIIKETNAHALYDGFLSQYGTSQAGFLFDSNAWAQYRFILNPGPGEKALAGPNIAHGAWEIYTFVIEGTLATLYFNGTYFTSNNTFPTGGMNPSLSNVHIGRGYAGGTTFDGKVAEVRITHAAESAAWAAAEYNNLINNAAWATGANDNCDP